MCAAVLHHLLARPTRSIARAGTPRAGPPCDSGIAMRAAAADARKQQRLRRSRPGRRRLARRRPARDRATSTITLARWAMPSTSRISATVPSPMMVAPAKAAMPLSCLPSGLTTISSVSLMLVDDQAELAVVGLQDDDVDRLVRRVRAARSAIAQLAVEVDQRQQVAAQPVDRRAVDASRCRRAPARPRGAPARAG